MAKHKPATVWALREDARDYVRTDGTTQVLVVYRGEGLTLTRMDARLLARRINQCLDSTK